MQMQMQADRCGKVDGLEVEDRGFQGFEESRLSSLRSLMSIVSHSLQGCLSVTVTVDPLKVKLGTP